MDKNYFEFYNIPITLTPDTAALKKEYYRISKEFHPDFFANDADKMAEAMEVTTLNNNAYKTLTNADKLVKYVLELHDMLEEGEKNSLPQEFLMEMMEVNEQLMELEFAPDAEALSKVKTEVEAKEAELNGEMNQLAEEFEQAEDKKAVLAAVKEVYLKNKYLLRIKESLSKFAAS